MKLVIKITQYMIWLLCVILALACIGAGLAEKAMRERHMYDYGDYLP